MRLYFEESDTDAVEKPTTSASLLMIKLPFRYNQEFRYFWQQPASRARIMVQHCTPQLVNDFGLKSKKLNIEAFVNTPMQYSIQ